MSKNIEVFEQKKEEKSIQLIGQIIKIKDTLKDEIVVPKLIELKQAIMKSSMFLETNKKINEVCESKLSKQIQELLQMINERPLVQKVYFGMNAAFNEFNKKVNPQVIKEKSRLVKCKINDGKNKLKEMNENLNKKTSVIIAKKMMNNFMKGQGYLNYAMASILLDKKLKNHPMRIQLVYAIDQAVDYLSIKEALKLLQYENIISNPQIVEIIELVSQTNYPQCLALCKIAIEFSETNEENMLEIMRLVSETEDYNCVKSAVNISLNNAFDFDTKLKLISEIVKGDIYTSTLITILATEYREQLNGDLMEIAELVNLYKNHSKLESATTQMLGENGLLSNDNLRQTSIETLKHFSDYEDDETEMFGCIELFNEETDPTYEREYDIVQQELLDMPNKQRTKVFKLIRKLSPVIQNQVSKSK
ncbi:MAG: hypothetical protein HFH45_02040 [Bacilli bacterium]|nr:hypothetical protein [Bacilli bacterium]